MIRLVITLFVALVTTFVAYAHVNCTDKTRLICGNTCTSYGKTCYCGGETFKLGYDFDLVCASSSDCMFDSDGMQYAL